MPIHWTLKPYHQLLTDELYSILQLRSAVFVVEQSCAFQDMDNKDKLAWHLMGWQDQQLVAYTRLLPPGAAYTCASIGRVVTASVARRTGAGRELMTRSIAETERLFGKGPIKIGAQLYLREFYQSLGFEQTSDIYDEDGIDHIEMIRGGD